MVKSADFLCNHLEMRCGYPLWLSFHTEKPWSQGALLVPCYDNLNIGNVIKVKLLFSILLNEVLFSPRDPGGGLNFIQTFGDL